MSRSSRDLNTQITERRRAAQTGTRVLFRRRSPTFLKIQRTGGSPKPAGIPLRETRTPCYSPQHKVLFTVCATEGKDLQKVLQKVLQNPGEDGALEPPETDFLCFTPDFFKKIHFNLQPASQ